MKTHINVGLQIKKKKLLGVGTSSLFALGFIVFGMYSSTLNQSPAYAAGSPTDFVTTWKTDNPGTSNSSSITIPTEGTGYNYEVDWDDDGTFDQTGITGDVTHDFGVPGEYTIRIRGDFPQIYFTFPSDNTKLIRVDQWGTNPWRSMQNKFAVVTGSSTGIGKAVTEELERREYTVGRVARREKGEYGRSKSHS